MEGLDYLIFISKFGFRLFSTFLTPSNTELLDAKSAAASYLEKTLEFGEIQTKIIYLLSLSYCPCVNLNQNKYLYSCLWDKTYQSPKK